VFGPRHAGNETEFVANPDPDFGKAYGERLLFPGLKPRWLDLQPEWNADVSMEWGIGPLNACHRAILIISRALVWIEHAAIDSARSALD
jgi:hypothetical protein